MFSKKLHYLLMSKISSAVKFISSCGETLSLNILKKKNHSSNLAAVMRVMNSAAELQEKTHLPLRKCFISRTDTEWFCSLPKKRKCGRN